GDPPAPFGIEQILIAFGRVGGLHQPGVVEDVAEHAVMRFKAVGAELQRRIEVQRCRPVEGSERTALAQPFDVFGGRPENVETRGHAMFGRVDYLGGLRDMKPGDEAELDRKAVKGAEPLRYGLRLARVQGLAEDDKLALLLRLRDESGDLRRKRLGGLRRRTRRNRGKDHGAERKQNERRNPARHATTAW